MSLYGYARVSTNGQALDAQVSQLLMAGCACIFQEKLSGSHRERPALCKMLRILEVGDVVVITRLDRLARSTRDLLNIVAELDDKGVRFRSLCDAWADTTTPHGELMLTMLAGLAQFERHLIRQRTSEGRERARQRGVRFGRPPKLSSERRRSIIQRLSAGESKASIARAFNVSLSTILRLGNVEAV